MSDVINCNSKYLLYVIKRVASRDGIKRSVYPNQKLERHSALVYFKYELTIVKTKNLLNFFR